MPLFVYECKACHAETEILVRGSEQPACPECGSKKLSKLVSAITPMSAAPKKRGAAPAPSCGANACCGMPGSCGMN